LRAIGFGRFFSVGFAVVDRFVCSVFLQEKPQGIKNDNGGMSNV
jgi:hypothetical protein